jgi:hypothetical protein
VNKKDSVAPVPSTNVDDGTGPGSRFVEIDGHVRDEGRVHEQKGSFAKL